MILNTTDEIKKWFRSIPLAKKEMELRIKFYEDLISDYARPQQRAGTEGRGTDYMDPGFYQSQIETAQNRYDSILKDVDRLFELLDGDERAILTAKYLNRISWDAMEFHIFYSRRQAYRIHNRAIEKLAGQTVGGGIL